MNKVYHKFYTTKLVNKDEPMMLILVSFLDECKNNNIPENKIDDKFIKFRTYIVKLTLLLQVQRRLMSYINDKIITNMKFIFSACESNDVINIWDLA